MRLSDFDYPLPPGRIAQAPLADRAGARMLVLRRAAARWEDRLFRDLPQYLGAGDCLVLNDTRVLPCRLLNGNTEIFLLRPLNAERTLWTAIGRPGRRLRPGVRVAFGAGLTAEIVAAGERGERTVRLECAGPIGEALDAAGHIPLPPYIRRPDTAEDRARYQTVFARERGSAAAPTAGLHFTGEMLAACAAAGADVARVTLHVGLGTFQPLQREQIKENRLHAESYALTAEAAEQLRHARRIVAVGTTSVRVLETVAAGGPWRAASGETSIFIYPGYQFRAAGALLTNFHLPQSSLLMLVAAFAGRELTLAAYHHAVREGYRFFSYGDCMLVL